jgi:hypothetical protein
MKIIPDFAKRFFVKCPPASHHLPIHGDTIDGIRQAKSRLVAVSDRRLPILILVVLFKKG